RRRLPQLRRGRAWRVLSGVRAGDDASDAEGDDVPARGRRTLRRVRRPHVAHALRARVPPGLPDARVPGRTAQALRAAVAARARPGDRAVRGGAPDRRALRVAYGADRAVGHCVVVRSMHAVYGGRWSGTILRGLAVTTVYAVLFVVAVLGLLVAAILFR